MKLDAYGCYTIQSALGAPQKEGYIHVPFASIADGQEIRLWTWDSTGRTVDHFEWLLVPIPGTDHTYYIVSRRSGLPLRVRGNEIVQGLAAQTTTAEKCEQATQWLFEPDETGAMFRIANQLTGHYLAAWDAQTANDTKLSAPESIIEKGKNDQFRLFRLQHVTTLMGDLPKPITKAGPRIPQLKNLHTDLPAQTEPVLREIEAMPFLAINDPIYPPHRQVDISPYYTLALSTLWRKVFDRQLDGIVERETEEITETGLTTLDAQTVASTFSWSVSTEAQVGYKGFGFNASLKVAAKLAGETQKTTQATSERRQGHMFTETILYPAIGKPYRLAKWRPVDRYE